MGRIWICLPLCLLLQDQRPMVGEASGVDRGIPAGAAQVSSQEKRRLELSKDVFACAARMAILPNPATLSWDRLHPYLVDPRVFIARDFANAVAGMSAAGTVPPLGPANLPALLRSARAQQQAFDDMLADDPSRFLAMCLARYEREIKGYTCKFDKRERIGETLHPPELVDVYFQEKPFSVIMDWKSGARFGLARKALYVEGQNDGKLLAKPNVPGGNFLTVQRDVHGEDAKKSSRYTIDLFGMAFGMRRTLTGLLEARNRGALQVKYYGIEVVPRLNKRQCHKFVRAPIDPPEEDGLAELTIYIDVENWLQVGSVLKNTKGELIAEYFFRDVVLNPTFKAKQFDGKTF